MLKNWSPHILATWRGDVTFLSRQLIPGIPSLECLLKRPLVLDVDDAVWLSQPLGGAAGKFASSSADIVVAANSHIAEWYSRYANDIRIIPTSVDTERFKPKNPPPNERFVIGWTGSSSNLDFVHGIQEPLSRFLLEHPAAFLRVICDERPRFKHIDDSRVEFVRWSPEIEVTALQDINVGIMPLDDNPWTRGKSALKMLQYLSLGRPAIAAPVGVCKTILDEADVGWSAMKSAEWLEALEACYREPENAARKGTAGRELVVAKYSVHSSTRKLARVFQELI